MGTTIKLSSVALISKINSLGEGAATEVVHKLREAHGGDTYSLVSLDDLRDLRTKHYADQSSGAPAGARTLLDLMIARLEQANPSSTTPAAKNELTHLTDRVRADEPAKVDRVPGVPDSWKRISDVGRKIEQLIERGEFDLQLQLAEGSCLALEPAREMIQFAKKGFFQLYVKTKSAEGPIYYLVPTARCKILTEQMEKFATTAATVSKEISTALESLRRSIHASRVNGAAMNSDDFDLGRLKQEVSVAINEAKAAILTYEEALKQYNDGTQRMPYPEGEIDLFLFAKRVLDGGAPRSDCTCMRDLDFVKDLIRANELLMKRPEVLAVDPGDGIRISVDVRTLVENGGDYNSWQEEITALMAENMIVQELQFSTHGRDDAAADAALGLLRGAVGEACVSDGCSMGNMTFSDGVYGSTFTFRVETTVVTQAQASIPEIVKAMARYGVDPQHLQVTVKAEE